MHHEQRLEDSDREAIVNDTLLALGLAFEQIGQVNLAAQVASEVAAASPLIADPDVAFRVAGFMFRSRRILEALRLADALDQSEDEQIRMASFVLLSPTLASGDDLSEEEWRETERVLRRRAERRERAGNLRDAASEYYNLGNHFKTSRRGREAFKSYHRAIRLRPDYLARDYFNGEIAGVLFELGHHQLAAHYYRRAIELGSSGMAHALYADALLWSGRYREADEALAEYLADDPNGHAEWRLKRLLLSHLRQVIGDTQQRRPEAAESLAELRDDDTPETARARLEQALAYDALCGEGWFLLAILAAADPDSAFPLALTGALLHRHSPSAWRNAMILCWMSESHRSQLKDVAGAGYFLNGQALLDEVIDYARGHGEEFDKREFLRIVEEAVRSVEDEQRGFEIRVLGEGSEYVSLRFDPPESNLQG